MGHLVVSATDAEKNAWAALQFEFSLPSVILSTLLNKLGCTPPVGIYCIIIPGGPNSQQVPKSDRTGLESYPKYPLAMWPLDIINLLEVYISLIFLT